MSAADGARRARPRVRPPAGRALGAGAAVLAALVVGHVVTSAFPVDERVAAPFVREGDVGDTLDLRYARLTVEEPTGSTVLAPEVGSLLATPGVWLVVPVTVEAKGQPRALAFAELLGGDGRTYTVFTGGRSAFLPGAAQPGVPRHATLHVEVPPEAVAGARLRVGLDVEDQRHDDVAEVDLGLTQDDADAWSTDDTSVRAPAASDAPPEQP
ncbi:hypothetical protein [Cellulomonas iranensis]|uniref:DUF4352 domain-containing protein n=2 Tax=Cellulomonas iranensis TaxID=76862 RepID=A0ABU0GHX6_9CELL|nr:hypothetical protein [Cellulomonas iranensis]MDQ0424192.1 hypothetical protein [Cellulomonas iranensis]